MKELLRVACVSPRVHIGNVKENAKEIISCYEKYKTTSDVIVTPELSLTGYTCGDLFSNRFLLENVKKALVELCDVTKLGWESAPVLLVGLPLEVEGEVFNCAAAICNGEILGIIPKTYLPNYGEFYEKRWFSARKISNRTIILDGYQEGKEIPFGNDILIQLKEPQTTIGVEICEDAWTPISPGRMMALHGAEVIVNLSASNEVIGKEQYRRNLMSSTSASCLCGYVYVSSGMYESTSDLVFSGHKIAYVNGKCVAECKPFEEEDLLCDIQLTKIKHDRTANKSFADCRRDFESYVYRKVYARRNEVNKEELLGKISMTPFVPSKDVTNRCLSIFKMQVYGLQRRLVATKSKCVVVGVSGGLDSTLALLVAAKAIRNLQLPATTLVGITMPGFGTTDRTKNNSLELMEKLGCDVRTISIVDSVRQHFKDINHPEEVHDITYENCQARERTQILMDVANKEGGFVLGTGDLSELALGWCTYNGDHMSMYAVNTSIPKTLVRTLVDEIGHYMDANGFEGMAEVIEDIIDTPVSPELLPPNPDGTIAQKTEDTIGSYILHDFFLYYTLRYGMEPEMVYELCKEAIKRSEIYKFSDEDIKKWLKVFYRRFFGQQFKRNCMPDGVKVGTVSVSPRGDLRLPSEIESEEWLVAGDDIKEDSN